MELRINWPNIIWPRYKNPSSCTFYIFVNMLRYKSLLGKAGRYGGGVELLRILIYHQNHDIIIGLQNKLAISIFGFPDPDP